MTAKIIEVLNPTAMAINMESKIAPRVDDLNGKVIGLLNNTKPNFDIFLNRIEELLYQRFNFADILHITKRVGNTLPLPEDQMEELVAKCDVVVNGMCD